ncbi:Csu type fimbrial protein [Billgrantia endophytica]|uniref:SCPU domain-containing protein n=1 Tax=Billgrantia endophytica TaxID=2033802 RepID=A0A2N7U0N3_9GAMM|nr:spore coat U domain-containing protein [Halomonas endophytica]PMR73995.1 SCPU domain-containing protein [Halomonas endophytica]
MTLHKTYLSLAAASIACLLPLSQSHAAVSGQVQATLNIDSGCEVNGSVSGSANDFGELDFGRSGPIWSNVLTAELATGGGGALEVTCDSGVGSFSVSIDGGLNGDRALSGPDSNTVDYELYQDAGRTQEFVANTPVSYTVSSGDPIAVPVYGSILPNATAKDAGLYTDTLTVTVEF